MDHNYGRGFPTWNGIDGDATLISAPCSRGNVATYRVRQTAAFNDGLSAILVGIVGIFLTRKLESRRF
jgi:hypothetical protein